MEQPCHASLPYPVPAKVYKCGRVGDAKVKIAKVLGVQRYNGENIVMVRYVDDSLEIVPTAEVRKEDPEVRLPARISFRPIFVRVSLAAIRTRVEFF